MSNTFEEIDLNGKILEEIDFDERISSTKEIKEFISNYNNISFKGELDRYIELENINNKNVGDIYWIKDKEVFCLWGTTPDDNSGENRWVNISSNRLYSDIKNVNISVDEKAGRGKVNVDFGSIWNVSDIGINLDTLPNGEPGSINGIQYILSENCYYLNTTSGLFKTYNSNLSECFKINVLSEQNPNDPDNPIIVTNSTLNKNINLFFEISHNRYILCASGGSSGTRLYYYSRQKVNDTQDYLLIDITNVAPTSVFIRGWLLDKTILSNENDIVDIIFTSGSEELLYVKLDISENIPSIVSSHLLTNFKILENGNQTNNNLKKCQYILRHTTYIEDATGNKNKFDYIFVSGHVSDDTSASEDDTNYGLYYISANDFIDGLTPSSDGQYKTKYFVKDDTFKNSKIYNIRNLSLKIPNKEYPVEYPKNLDILTITCKAKNNIYSQDQANGLYQLNAIYVSSYGRFAISFSPLSRIYDGETSYFDNLLPFDNVYDVFKYDRVTQNRTTLNKIIETLWTFVVKDENETDNNYPKIIKVFEVFNPDSEESNYNDYGYWNTENLIDTNFTIGNEEYPKFFLLDNWLAVNGKTHINEEGNEKDIGFFALTLIPNNSYIPTMDDIHIRRIYFDGKVTELDVNGSVKLESSKPNIASKVTLGLVKIGDGLSISADGVLTHNNSIATTTQAGVVVVGDNIMLKPDTGLISVNTATKTTRGVVISGANTNITDDGVLSVPVATQTNLGVVKVPSSSNISIDSVGNISVPVGSSTVAGVIKLGDGLSIDEQTGKVRVSGYSLPLNSNGNIRYNDGQLTVDTADKTTRGVVKIGQNILITNDGVISIPSATESTSGVIKLGTGLNIDSETGKVNVTGLNVDLNDNGNISFVSNKLTVNTANNATRGVVKIGDNISVTSEGVISVIPASAGGLGVVSIIPTDEYLTISDGIISAPKIKTDFDSVKNSIVNLESEVLNIKQTLDNIIQIADSIIGL